MSLVQENFNLKASPMQACEVGVDVYSRPDKVRLMVAFNWRITGACVEKCKVYFQTEGAVITILVRRCAARRTN
jgi:hypothetical protein